MSPNQQILTKAIQKAIDGGWSHYGLNHYIVDQTGKFVTFDNFDIKSEEWTDSVHIVKQFEALIFNHDFAKAIWNTPKFAIGMLHFETRDGLSEWQYHLQQMVIADDPVKYLEQNI